MSALGVRKPPEIFIFTFIILSACLSEIVGERNLEVDQEPERVVFEPVQAKQQIVSGPAFRAAAFSAGLFEAGQVAMEGEALAQSLPVAGMEGLERSGRERRFAAARAFPTALQASRRQSLMAAAQASLSNWISALSSRR